MPTFHFTEVLKAQYFPRVTSNISVEKRVKHIEMNASEFCRYRSFPIQADMQDLLFEGSSLPLKTNRKDAFLKHSILMIALNEHISIDNQ